MPCDHETSIKHALEAIGAGLFFMLGDFKKLSDAAAKDDCPKDVYFQFYQLSNIIQNQIHIADNLQSREWDGEIPICEGCGKPISNGVHYFTYDDGPSICEGCCEPGQESIHINEWGDSARLIDEARAAYNDSPAGPAIATGGGE